MIDLILLYAFILGMALLNWGLNRFALTRGLEIAFFQERQKPYFHNFFETHKAAYIKTLIWVALYVLMVGFSAGRLLYLLGLWSFETALIGLAILIFLTKERVHYITGVFVMMRVKVERP